MQDHVLVAGATGVVGQAVVRHFAKRGDCQVTALSRRKPDELWGARHCSVDLNDEQATHALVSELRDVTHLVFAALYEKPGLIQGWLEADQIETNARMLRNLFEPLDTTAERLRHVTLLQGTKAYGAHVRPLPIPAREHRSELRSVPNFYWQQEDYLRAKQAGKNWVFTILRPQIIFGLSIGAAMNLIPVIGVYAAIARARGEALAYPGGDAPVLEAVDADLLAEAIDWAGRTPEAVNEIFNVTNGDVFRWQDCWPAMADALGLEVGTPEPVRLAECLPALAPEWDQLRSQHKLVAPDLLRFLGESIHYADFCMAYGATSPPSPALVSTIKLRQAGFHVCMDTEAMFKKWFRVFEHARLLPSRDARQAA